MKRYIDLTVPLVSGMFRHGKPLWFGMSGAASIIPASTPDMPDWGGITATWVSHAVHHGSHIDAQEHLVPWGHQIHEYPVETFIGDALVIDIDPQKKVTAEDMERMYGEKIKGIKMLLFRVGKQPGAKEPHEEGFWRTWQETSLTQGREGGLTIDAIEWCAEHGIKAMNHEGISQNAPDGFGTMLRLNIVNFHFVRNLDKITKERVFLIALPQLIIPGESSPVRIVAVEDDNHQDWEE